MRETPKAVRIDTSSVFKHEDKKVILAADLAFIEQIPFLVTISRGLGLMTVQNVESKKHASIMAAVRHVQSLYKKHGFVVHTLLSDTKSAVKGIELALGDIGIKLNLASS